MPRLILILAAVALTVFAIADWVSRSRTWTPGRVNRWLWLAVIVLIPIVGPLTWIIVGLVARAEDKQREAEEPRVLRPDDDPDAISSVAERLARRQKRTRPPIVRNDADGPGRDTEDPTDDADKPEKRGNQGEEDSAG